jgi:putative endonuclease
MACVYILQSQSTRRFYVGSTNDLPRRLDEHARGHSLATRARGPWQLVYQETFLSLVEARRREHEIKQWKSSKRIAMLLLAANGSSGPS